MFNKSGKINNSLWQPQFLDFCDTSELTHLQAKLSNYLIFVHKKILYFSPVSKSKLLILLVNKSTTKPPRSQSTADYPKPKSNP